MPIHVKVTIAGGEMTIDLSGCSAERKAGINSRTLAGARVAYKALTGPLDPVNEGSFRALKVIIPEGNIMMARFPAPMAGWSIIVPTVVDTIVTALAPAMPDRVPAGHHGLLGGAVVFFGLHPKTGRRFVVQSIEGGGWGGRPFEDGESATVSVCQGDVRNGSIEGIELKCPVLVEGRALRQDSCGAGKHRGGLRHRHAGAQPGRGPVELRAHAARRNARPGACGAAKPASPAATCCGCRARTISSRWSAPISRCRSRRGDRAHRRGRRLGRPARARPRAGARRRRRRSSCRWTAAREQYGVVLTDELWRRRGRDQQRCETRLRSGRNTGAGTAWRP